jgi:hypothetical protein
MVRAHLSKPPGSFNRELHVDIDILNFALTLEHLENAFYSQGLSRFTQEDFVGAGFPDWSYGRLKQIAAHEAAHVKLLETTLGDKATKPCTYQLFVIPRLHVLWLTLDDVPSSPYDDPKSFITVSRALEVVGKYLIVAADFSGVSYIISCLRGRGIHRRIEVL